MSWHLRVGWIILLFTITAGASAAPTLLVMGDSLSAGYGLKQNEGWVALLQQRLMREKYPYRVVNASISGETSAGGLARIDDELKRHRPRIVIIALGANDGLRGLPLQQLRNNLDAMVRKTQKSGAHTLLVGMRLPPNYGPAYTTGFETVFRDVARTRRVALAPFLLDGLATNRDFFQADGLHPTAAAQARLLDNIWPRLKDLLKPVSVTTS